MSENLTLAEAILALEMDPRGVRLSKLYDGTAIADCESGLAEYLGLRQDVVFGRPNGGYALRPQVKDFPHPIWRCEIGKHSERRGIAYGKSIEEAIERALSLRK